MGVRVVNWANAHPDDEPGFGVLLARLQALVVRMGDVITAQRNGFIDTRAARSRKQELRTEVAVPIAHLAQIGALAAREVHELGKTFRFRPSASSQVAFHSACRAMLEAAQTHKEVLVQHGLSESVLVEFERLVDPLLAQAEEYAERYALETEQRAVLADLDVPLHELPLLAEGMVLAGLYQLARELREQGMS